jgi:hypothetical protein
MRTTELVLIVMIVLGCIFKIQHWPGAGALYVTGGCGLALFYFPFGFRTLPAPKSTDQMLWMTLLAGASLCMALVGYQVTFLQRWPNSATLLLCGCTMLCLHAAHRRGAAAQARSHLEIYLDGLLIRCLVLGGLAFTLWALFAGKPH